ncbi:hypothetical protein [Aquimarina sp. 2304DJ70-9]|uniref:hypothetical protein n=1 Tax=Aquimarina penaris TaxID=3231044 RepID=UPI00346349B0
MDYLFKIVYDILKFLEKLTGLSYEEINIVIWFFFIPFTWMFLLDKITNKHYFKTGFASFILISLLLVPSFKIFSNWLFNASVDFLNLFNTIGSSYKTSSVIICLFIPIVIYIFLIRKIYFDKR